MNLYALPSHFSGRLPAAALDTPLLLQLIEMASREVDGLCKRSSEGDLGFYVKHGARYFGGCSAYDLVVDDLLSISELATDDGTETWPNVWAAEDYRLWPWNSWPKMKIERTGNGDYDFLTNRSAPYYARNYGERSGRDVRITGKFGYGDGRRQEPWNLIPNVTITLADASTTTATTSTNDAVEPGSTLLVENEQIYVSAVDSATLTVERAVNGTTAAAHAAVAVSIAAYPNLVTMAVLNLVVDYWKHKGGAEMLSEKWADYEYERQQLSSYCEFRQDQMNRMLGPYTRLAVA